jgi:hypothetical protein
VGNATSSNSYDPVAVWSQSVNATLLESLMAKGCWCGCVLQVDTG